MIHVAAFSGGKDSTALLLWLKEQGIAHETVFCDTGFEHEMTYGYVDKINETLLGGRLIRLKSEKYADMYDLVKRRKRVPSAKARFCTEELKISPMEAYLKGLDDEVTCYQGIRAEESPRRARMKEREWSDRYDCWVERPLFRWTVAEVFACLARHGIEPNPLYTLGAKRVGCFPCVMTRHGEMKRLSKTLPEVWERIAALEASAGRSFFPPDYIPARFHSLRDPKSGKTFPSIADVQKYLDESAQSDLFVDDDGPSCMSVYNLCE